MKSFLGAYDGFFSGPPNSFLDYLVSFHSIPITASLILALLLCIRGGLLFWSILMIILGILVTAVFFTILPLPIIGPIGGHYHVGLVHLDGNRSQSLPPLAIFYPTNTPPQKRGAPYVPFNDPIYLSGMASYGKVPLYVMKDLLFVRLKVSPDAPPIPLNDLKTPPPIIVFSHGLSGHYQFYGCLCADLAARGAIVISIGHCDGSASFTRIVQGDKSEGNDVPFKHLGWEVPVREAQLTQRVRELRHTLNRIKEMDFWKEIGYEELDIQKYLKEPLQLHLSGHSFGGATALAAALQEEQVPGKKSVKSVIVFDPWHLPLQNEHFFQPIAEGKMRYTTPTYMVFSENWSKDKEIWDFFQRVTSAVLGQTFFASFTEELKHSFFFTEKTPDTNHYFVSDLCVLSPVMHGKLNAVVPSRARIVECSNTLIRVAKQYMDQTNS
ncbi:phospholipase A2-like protein [Trypanosoma theileri]|uniref:1-alkyl-2-acetylglycerophosphocholine esterase n=1 Tax=Trypanosoma theileri TaxID=67003 RepID=A0A1X0P5D8_9TRYP|nr:phospholipase A2-like protein [Trypanosoma theileri]ORC92164.1 phospholipase A2-like protein [Trypanosoma theileri]